MEEVILGKGFGRVEEGTEEKEEEQREALGWLGATVTYAVTGSEAL